MKLLPLQLTTCILAETDSAQTRRAVASAPQQYPILVIDTGAGNEWADLENQNKRVHIVNHPVSPITDFAAVRNFALTHCQTEWVFFLDSDEVFLPNQEKELQALIISSDFAAFTIIRKDSFLGKTLQYGEASTHLVRLVRTADAKFVGSVHEVAVVQGKVASSSLELLHDSHASINQFLSAVTAYAQIAGAAKQQQTSSILLELLCFPPAKFLLNFFGKLGCLDGWRGLVYATLMSYHSIFVRVFTYEKTTKKN